MTVPQTNTTPVQVTLPNGRVATVVPGNPCTHERCLIGFREAGMSHCAYGCKVFACSHGYWVGHSQTYGCTVPL